jgi:hopanoid biosynthesis associated RND transporter like protein HpnN
VRDFLWESASATRLVPPAGIHLEAPRSPLYEHRVDVPDGEPAEEPATGPGDGVGRALSRWVVFCLRHGIAVVAAIAVVTAAAGFCAFHELGYNVDPNEMFAKDLRFQRMIETFSEHFPVLTNSLLVVVEAETPEVSREAADALAERLAARRDAFRTVYFPGEESFFESHGLLYSDVDVLDDFASRMARLQPAIAELSRDPTLPTLTYVLERGLDHLGDGEDPVETGEWITLLDHFRRATFSVYAEFPIQLSWESILLDGSGLDPETLRVIVAEPLMDWERVLAASEPIAVIRDAVADLGLEADGVTVRVTGYPALNHEEFLGIARDTALAGGLSFVLVVAVLFVAFRSWTIVITAAVTLLIGVLWTAGYASLSVGRLNAASITFAVLFIGLGIDFSIHLGMVLVEGLRYGATVSLGIVRSVRTVGSALLLCALTTAIGFLAFLPTDYTGVSELGVISAGGMVIIVFLTLTLFPVLVSLCLRGRSLERLRARTPISVPIPVPRRPALVCAIAGALGVVGLAFVPLTHLETNVVMLRNPNQESVEAFVDLLESSTGTPWYLDMLAPNLARAESLAEEARELPVVDRAVSLADFVPDDQDEKLEILSDVALFLDLPAQHVARAPPPLEEQLAALRKLARVLDANERLERVSPSLAASARLLHGQLVEFLGRLEADPRPEAALELLEAQLLAPLPVLFDRLRTNLDTPEITQASLPAGLQRRMLASDGKARVQVFPAENLWERARMIEFVESIRVLWPDITGLPVNLVESAYATWESLREAMVLALCAIALLLLLLWRSPLDTVFALLPLLLAIVLTAAATVVFGVSLNFANICVLPLMLGIGIDSAVHMVHRSKGMSPAGGELVGSITVQAVFYSALTSLMSFGTLVLSAHRGIASLGELLAIGMVLTLAGNLILLPALLVLGQRLVRRPSDTI